MNLIDRAQTILADAEASHDAKALAQAILRHFEGDSAFATVRQTVPPVSSGTYTAFQPITFDTTVTGLTVSVIP